ncbi:hypothetical protein ACO2WH_25845, partial [Escherichia coli]|uniref:hypothetical protein n=1 Tax=Escherichia coli TaxID=562 RepID=UPI003C04268F
PLRARWLGGGAWGGGGRACVSVVFSVLVFFVFVGNVDPDLINYVIVDYYIFRSLDCVDCVYFLFGFYFFLLLFKFFCILLMF